MEVVHLGNFKKGDFAINMKCVSFRLHMLPCKVILE
jgi:hypothetical protein